MLRYNIYPFGSHCFGHEVILVHGSNPLTNGCTSFGNLKARKVRWVRAVASSDYFATPCSARQLWRNDTSRRTYSARTDWQMYVNFANVKHECFHLRGRRQPEVRCCPTWHVLAQPEYFAKNFQQPGYTLFGNLGETAVLECRISTRGSSYLAMIVALMFKIASNRMHAEVW